MVKCQHCGHISKRELGRNEGYIVIRDGKTLYQFCSSECMVSYFYFAKIDAIKDVM